MAVGLCLHVCLGKNEHAKPLVQPPTKEDLMMKRSRISVGCRTLFVASLLLFLSACTALEGKKVQAEDPGMVALRRDIRQVAANQEATQHSVEDMYDRLNALDAKIDFLETNMQELSDRPQPILITPGNASSSERGPSKPVRASMDSSAGTMTKEKQPPSKKSTAKKATKKASISSKRSPRREYDQAYAAYKGQRYDEALALFKAFLTHFPKDDLADNAQYWIGEIYYDIENYPSAILAFKEVVTVYGDRNKAPDALLKIGYAYIALDDPNNARIFFKRVIKNYPFSDAEAKAREKLKELQNL